MLLPHLDCAREALEQAVMTSAGPQLCYIVGQMTSLSGAMYYFNVPEDLPDPFALVRLINNLVSYVPGSENLSELV